VVAFLIEQTGSQFVPAYYLMAAALVGLVPILMMRETAGEPLRGTSQSGQTGWRFPRNAAMPSLAPGVCDAEAMTSSATL
jgi:hypothetical protein